MQLARSKPLQSDTTTRLLLVAILVGLAILILQNVLGARTPAPPPAAGPVFQPLPPPTEPGVETFRNRGGRELSAADLVVLARSVGNEALPLDMRVWSALQLERVEHPDAAQALIAALDSPEEVLSTAALQALVGNRDPRVRKAALRAAEHEDESVQAVADYVLESLEGEPSDSTP